MQKTTKSPTTDACPCGGGVYANCCAPFHLGAPAPDAASLMRSRYSAYVLQLEPYLLATWHPDSRPEALELQEDHTKWLSLEVKHHAVQSATSATVEFVARYKVNGRAHKLHEVSRFLRDDGCWLYLDGIISE